MGINLHFSNEAWGMIERNWTAWWDGDLPRPLVVIESVSPEYHKPLPHGFTSNYPLHMTADEVLDLYQELLEAKHFHGDAFPRWEPSFGPGIIAGFLGAKVHSTLDTVWFGPEEIKGLSELSFVYERINPMGGRSRRSARRDLAAAAQADKGCG